MLWFIAIAIPENGIAVATLHEKSGLCQIIVSIAIKIPRGKIEYGISNI